MIVTVFAIFALHLAQLEAVPENPSPLTEGATRIFETGRLASEGLAASFDTLWLNVMQGGLYQAMADLGTVISVAALGLFLVQWAQQLMSREGDKAFSELIWPVIVIVCLNNNGAVLSTVTLELRDIGNQINNTVLASAVNNESLQQEYQQSRLGGAIDDVEAASFTECREKYQGRAGRPLQACFNTARTAANQLRQQYGLVPSEESGLLQSALQWLVRNLFWAIHTAFQYALEIVLLIVALLGPLAMGLSLMPGQNKALFTWLAGLANLFLMKLTLNLVSGLAAYAVSLQSGIHTSMILPVLLGFIAPTLSIMVGLQGGAALFNALSAASVYAGYRTASGGVAMTGKAIRKTAKLAAKALP